MIKQRKRLSTHRLSELKARPPPPPVDGGPSHRQTSDTIRRCSAAVNSLLIVAPIVSGGPVVDPSYAIILMGKRKLVALLLLSCDC